MPHAFFTCTYNELLLSSVSLVPFCGLLLCALLRGTWKGWELPGVNHAGKYDQMLWDFFHFFEYSGPDRNFFGKWEPGNNYKQGWVVLSYPDLNDAFMLKQCICLSWWKSPFMCSDHTQVCAGQQVGRQACSGLVTSLFTSIWPRWNMKNINFMLLWMIFPWSQNILNVQWNWTDYPTGRSHDLKGQLEAAFYHILVTFFFTVSLTDV